MGGHLILTGQYYLCLLPWGGWTPMEDIWYWSVNIICPLEPLCGTFDIDWSISYVLWSISFVPQSISNVPFSLKIIGDIWYWPVILTKFKLSQYSLNLVNATSQCQMSPENGTNGIDQGTCGIDQGLLALTGDIWHWLKGHLALTGQCHLSLPNIIDIKDN